MAIILGLVLTTACEQGIPPKKGMPNTMALSNGEVIYDLRGEWDSIIEIKNEEYGGIFNDIIEISQKGNEFVGIISTGNERYDKGYEMIKGELDTTGFKSIKFKTKVEGWKTPKVKIDENYNKIDIKVKAWGNKIILNLSRK